MPLIDENTNFGNNVVADAASRRQAMLQQLSLNQQYALSQQRYGLDAQDLALRRQQALASLGMEQQRIGLQGQQIGNEQAYRNRSLDQQYGAQQQQFGLEGQRVGLEGQRLNNEQAYRQQALAQASTQFQQGLQKDYDIPAMEALRRQRDQAVANGDPATAEYFNNQLAQFSHRGAIGGGAAPAGPQPQQPSTAPAPAPAPAQQPDASTPPAPAGRPLTDDELIDQYRKSPDADESTIVRASTKRLLNKPLSPIDRQELTQDGALPMQVGATGNADGPALKQGLLAAHDDHASTVQDIANSLQPGEALSPAQARALDRSHSNVQDAAAKYAETGHQPITPYEAAKQQQADDYQNLRNLQSSKTFVDPAALNRAKLQLAESSKNLQQQEGIKQQEEHLMLQKFEKHDKPNYEVAIQRAKNDLDTLTKSGSATDEQIQAAEDNIAHITNSMAQGVPFTQFEKPDRSAIKPALAIASVEKQVKDAQGYDQKGQIIQEALEKNRIPQDVAQRMIDNDPTTKMQEEINQQIAAAQSPAEVQDIINGWKSKLKGNVADGLQSREIKQFIRAQAGSTVSTRTGHFDTTNKSKSDSAGAGWTPGSVPNLNFSVSDSEGKGHGDSTGTSVRQADVIQRANDALRQQKQDWEKNGADTQFLLRHLKTVEGNVSDQKKLGSKGADDQQQKQETPAVQAGGTPVTYGDDETPGTAPSVPGAGPGGTPLDQRYTGMGGGEAMAARRGDLQKMIASGALGPAATAAAQKELAAMPAPNVAIPITTSKGEPTAFPEAGNFSIAGIADSARELSSIPFAASANDSAGGKQIRNADDQQYTDELHARMNHAMTSEGIKDEMKGRALDVALAILPEVAPEALAAGGRVTDALLQKTARMAGRVVGGSSRFGSVVRGGANFLGDMVAAARGPESAGMAPAGVGPIGAADANVAREAAASGAAPDPMAQAQAESAVQPQNPGPLRVEYDGNGMKAVNGKPFNNKVNYNDAPSMAGLQDAAAQGQGQGAPTQTFTREQALQDLAPAPSGAPTKPSSPGFTMDDFNLKPGEGTTGPSQTVTDPVGKLRQQMLYEVRPNVLNSQTPEIRNALLAEEPAASRANLLKDIGPDKTALDYGGKINNLVKGGGSNLPEFADLPSASQAKLKALIPEAPAAVKAEAEAAGESHLFLGGPKTQAWLQKKLYGQALERDVTRH